MLGGLWGRPSGETGGAVKRGNEPAASSLHPSDGTEKARVRAGSAQSGGWTAKQQPIGEILKACRERAGMTQEQLARKLHVDRSVLAKVETGAIKNPSYVLVKQWAAATEGLEMVNMDLTGGRDGWKKLTAMEAALKQVRSVMDGMSLRKRGAAKERSGTR
ncbi:helix-turn-helix domain-containing protein [Paenibacillus albicereus]|uniref:Helix-turn-helix domain-containing protein n=2 Tax=Paenibacillus albicereus TaxID=2726185 RepID=A0A6H2H3Z0_9BACL|nr:helix-turn-helix domain-containing protein [Paenibacillus albicereus]